MSLIIFSEFIMMKSVIFFVSRQRIAQENSTFKIWVSDEGIVSQYCFRVALDKARQLFADRVKVMASIYKYKIKLFAYDFNRLFLL